MSLLWTSILGLKKQVSHVPREVTCVHLLPATSILRFCSTCLLQEQTNPGVYYGYVSECDRARSIAQPFFKTPLVSHFLILAKAKHIAKPSVSAVRMCSVCRPARQSHVTEAGEKQQEQLFSLPCASFMRTHLCQASSPELASWPIQSFLCPMVMVIKGWFCKSLSFLLEVRIRVEMGTQNLLRYCST